MRRTKLELDQTHKHEEIVYIFRVVLDHLLVVSLKLIFDDRPTLHPGIGILAAKFLQVIISGRMIW